MGIRYTLNDIMDMVEEYYGEVNKSLWGFSHIYVKDVGTLCCKSFTPSNIFVDGEGHLIIEIDKDLL